MNIAYDNIIFSLQKAGGISVYWSELIKRIKGKSVDINFYEYPNSNIFRKYLNIETKLESKMSPKITRYLPFLRKLPDKSIFHSSYYRVSLQKNIINVTTVHDFVYEYYRTGLAKIVHKTQKKFAIEHSDGIICISYNTKKDLLNFYPHIDEKRIKVIHNGVSQDFYPLENKQSYLNERFENIKNKKYLLFVGDRSFYKNFYMAIELLKVFNDLYLVVVSNKDFTEQEKYILKDVIDRVYIYKGVNNYELNILYNNAFCLIYPSSYEGFGIPVVEAMKAGCPVIALNKSSIPEVAGEAGILLSDIKLEKFIDAIKLLENKAYRLDIIEKGFKQAEKFSWDRCFEETFSFYEELYTNKFGG